ncbi:MAG: hypothetical protein HC797_06905 [Anaerolineales bacterium]|nr:hypothetical protein [Anaerolineales bacterium]
MSRFKLNNATLHLIFSLLIGLGLGLAYSWFLSPVTYVDANPTILRADFKDQYRIVIAASYHSTQDLARAKARLNLLGDVDPVGALSAQAQRMLASGESFEKVRPLAQLATDLQLGYVSDPLTPTPLPTSFNTPKVEVTVEETESSLNVTEEAVVTSLPTLFFEQTPLIPTFSETITPRPTTTKTPPPGAPFALVGQETICDPASKALMQFMFIDSRRNQIAGVEIIVTWNQDEDRFFTGFKPELGNGYADFVMQSDTIYNVRVVTAGSFVQNIFAPVCTEPNGASYLGGIILTFQQP